MKFTDSKRVSSNFKGLRQFTVILLLVLAFCCVNIYASETGFKVISTGEDYTEIEFTLPEYEVKTIEYDGTVYQRLYHPEHGLIMEEGLPEVLSFSFLLSIPAKGIVEIDKPVIYETETKSGFTLFPSQGFGLEIDEKRGFIKDYDFYGKDVDYPGEFAQISPPAIMRDMRLVSVNINPMIYNPAREELTLARKLTIRVNFDQSEVGENEITLPERRRSRSFERLQRASVLNYDQFRNPATRNDYQKRSMIVVHHHTNNVEYLNALNGFLNWKRDKGFEVTAIDTGQYQTNNAIKNFIQNAYDNWDDPPEYVVIIGDKNSAVSVPIWTVPQPDAYIAGSADGDHPYSLLEGDDLLADVLVGRISIGSSTQLMTFWNKLRNYERIPYMADTDWYEQIVLVGDRRVGGNNTGVSGFYTTRYVKNIMERYNSDYDFTEIYDVPFATQMQQGITNGTTFFSFRGMETMAGWISPQPGDVNNGYMLPNINVLTCRTMNFAGGWRVGNLFRMGTPVEPRGAISALGMSWITDTAFNNNLTGALYRGLFIHDMKSMTEAKVYAKLEHYRAFWNSHRWRAIHYFQMLNLKGDPSMDVWKGVPKVMNAEYPEELPPGSNSILITVTDEQEQPVYDAWVTIRQGTAIGEEDVFVTGYTDERGQIIHYFGTDAAGEIKVAVTKPDYKPHIGSFEITGTAGVTYNQFVTNDDLAAGHRVNFDLSVRNHNNQAVNGVSGTISIESEYIDVEENQSAFGNIPANGNGASDDNFVIDISPQTPAGYRANFTLTLTDNAQNSWVSRFTLVISNGKLEVTALIIDDDDDGVLDPLEEAALMFRLTNIGNVDLTNISGELTGGGYGLDIISDEAFFGDINIAATETSRDVHIVVATSSYVMPGMSFDLELHLSNDDGFSQTIPVKLPIGTVTVNDPLGPCPYGYWIFDSGDEDYMEAPEYDWIELAPNLGGNGVNTGLRADYDDIQNVHTMDLPFTFRYYGEEYEIVTISANGWITFIETEMATQRNWRLPGALGPDPIIAAFWDNIDVGVFNNGAVYTYYDEEEAKFIIQWHQATNVALNAVETFQIILYDPEFHFTTTTDGPIKIQYHTFNNVNNRGGQPGGGQSQYGEWGNYCTIGISDHTGTRGLEYTFNNEYAPAARVLGNETALFITTGSLGFTPYVAIDEVNYVNETDNIPRFGETGEFNIRLINLGGEDSFNVNATLSSQDEYVTIIQNEADFGDIESQETATRNGAYTIEIADNVPDKHRLHFTLFIEAEGNISWNFRFHIDVAAPNLTTLTPLIYDPAPGGNNNGLIDPGEDLIVYLPIKNIGGAHSPPANINVTSENDLVEITEISEVSFMTVSSGQTLYPAISVSISEMAEVGTGLVFNYTFETGEYEFSNSFLLGVGGVVPIQLGTGNQVTSVSMASPINIYFRSLRGQTVYTAEELRDAGVTTGGPISEFGLFVTNAPEYPLVNFRVKMRHTDAENAAEHTHGPYTAVYSNNQYMPTAGGWDMLDLDPPFVWNGVDNILVDTAFSPVESWSSSGQIRYYQTPNGYRFTRGDAPDQSDVDTDTVSEEKPQARILIDTSAGDTANRPENLTANLIGGTEVRLSWTAPVDQQGLEGFNIYRNGIRINEEVVNDEEYIDVDFEVYGIGYYYVTSVYDTGETLPSNIVAVNFNLTASPEISPEEGNYFEPFNVTITPGEENSVIRYTLDGSEPTEDSHLYQEPFRIEYHTLVKAKAFSDNLSPSETVSAQYYILYPPRNLQAGGTLESVDLFWDRPWSPEEIRPAGTQARQSRLSARNEANRQNTIRNSNRDSRNNPELSRNGSLTDNLSRTAIIGYNIYRSLEDGEFIRVNEDIVADTTYNDTGLEEADYRYYITAVYEVGESEGSRPVNVGPLSVEDEDNNLLPYTTELMNAYPNPFNPETLIEFTLQERDKVVIEIYDISGRRVNLLVDDTFDSGRHRIVWSGDDERGRRLSSGIYFYRMNTTGYSETKKVLMLK